MSVEPLDLNRVTLSDIFQRPEPTGAMAGKHKISRLAQASAVNQMCGTEGQSSRRRSFKNDLVITQARNAYTRNGMRIRPGPRRLRLA
jgi:hypothetical protein